MNDHKIWLVLAVPTLVAMLAAVIHGLEKWKGADSVDRVFYVVLGLILSFGAMCIGIALVYNLWVGIALALGVGVWTYALAGPTLAEALCNVGVWVRKGIPFFALIVLILVVYTCVVFVRPFLATPTLPGFLVPKGSMREAEIVKQKIDEMRQTFQSAQASLQVQALQVDAAVAALTQAISDKNDEVRKLEAELDAMRADYERYKQVDSMNREQAESFVRTSRQMDEKNEWFKDTKNVIASMIGGLMLTGLGWLAGRFTRRPAASAPDASFRSTTYRRSP